jgi:hypothetical protein
MTPGEDIKYSLSGPDRGRVNRVPGVREMRRFVSWVFLPCFLACTACAQQPPKNTAAASNQAASNQAAGAKPAGSDWPQFLGPTGDSKSTERGILTKWPADGPPLVWQLPLGTG